MASNDTTTLNSDSPKPQQEENLNEEFNNLILTLPKHDRLQGFPLYQYQGFWYPHRNLKGVVSSQKNFKVQESDIFLVTPPKSGTTWLKALTFTTVNRAKFPITSSATNHPLTANNPHDLVPFFELKFYAGDNENPDLSSLASPRIFATHMPYDSLPEAVKKSNSCKIVYMCREPKDVFVSFWHFANRLMQTQGRSEKITIEGVFDMFCKGINGYGPLWDHILGYLKRSREEVVSNDRPGVLFLKYEEMKAQPGECLRRLANFLGCPFSDDEERSGVVEQIVEMCGFDNLAGLETNKSGRTWSGVENNAFFRRGAVGDWQNCLTDEMVARVDQITEEKFRGSSLKF